MTLRKNAIRRFFICVRAWVSHLSIHFVVYRVCLFVSVGEPASVSVFVLLFLSVSFLPRSLILLRGSKFLSFCFHSFLLYYYNTTTTTNYIHKRV